MSFNYFDPASVEFGICRGSMNNGQSVIVPADLSVQKVLIAMIESTRERMGLNESASQLEQYEPSQEHSEGSRAALPLDSPLAIELRTFYEAENLPSDESAVQTPDQITAYFCVIHDRYNEKLVAIRRASQFKAVLKKHLIYLVENTLKAVSDQMLKLDSDFDILLVDGAALINRVAAFEFLAEVDEHIHRAAVENTKALGAVLAEIDFEGIAQYVETHKRAARVVAALRGRKDLAETSSEKLRQECDRCGVAFQIVDGQMRPVPGQELAFLQLLDRRRYALQLVNGRWEQYEAGSRKSAGVRQDAPPGNPRSRAIGAS